MNETDLLQRIGTIVISIIPLLLRFFINFKKEETCISNNRKYLLNQIRVLLSEDYSKSIGFNDVKEVKIDDDFYSKLQDKFNDLLYSQTSKFNDFNKAIQLGGLSIKWIRYLKYLLVILSTITLIIFFFVLCANKEVNILKWYLIFAPVALLIVVTWIIKENYSDSFFNLCIKYEIERKE